MQSSSGSPHPDSCSVSLLPSASNAAVCLVAGNPSCNHALKLNKFTLCLNPDAPLFIKLEEEPEIEPRVKQVMIVEYDLSLMHQMAAVLRNAGYEVLESDDDDLSLEVLEMWSSIHVDLVIADSRMEGVLRQTFLDLRPEVKLLVTTARPQPQLKSQAGTEFMAKPFTTVELLKRVISLIGKKA